MLTRESEWAGLLLKAILDVSKNFRLGLDLIELMRDNSSIKPAAPLQVCAIRRVFFSSNPGYFRHSQEVPS